MRKRKHMIRGERGQTMVEFAVVLPIFCMLLLGIAQLGIAFNNYLNLTDAVRQGARYGAVQGCSGTCDRSGVVTTKVKQSASNLDTNNLTVTFPNTTWAPTTDLNVCGAYPYSINILGMVVASGNLNSCTTERIE